MQGMELSKAYYETFGRKMIQEKFPEYEDRIAVGLVGEGSECFGYDDEISKDHDYGPEFCMWMKRSDYEQIGEALQAEYEKLPDTFMGVKKQSQSLYGARRRGVRTIEGFYESLIGSPDGKLNWQDYFFVPEYRLATAVNGEVFLDAAGVFSAVREQLLEYFDTISLSLYDTILFLDTHPTNQKAMELFEDYKTKREEMLKNRI